jgi:hypothetical protein
MSKYRTLPNSVLITAVCYRRLGTHCSPYLQGSRSPRWKIISPETSVTNSQSTLHQIPEEADLITTRRMPQITHRTGSFPFRFSSYICVEISPQTNFTSSHSGCETLLPHICCFIRPNIVTPTWQATYVYIVQLKPDIPTDVLVKIPILLISFMTSRLLSKQIRRSHSLLSWGSKQFKPLDVGN